MRVDGDLTRKGERRAAEIVDAALRCLARDGYAGTSLQRVADEAGLPKRAVLYYFGSREGLFEHVVLQLGRRLLRQIDESVVGLDEPADIAVTGFETMWRGMTSDRALVVAWLGVRAEAATNPALARAASHFTDGLRRRIAARVDAALERGRRLDAPRDATETLILASIQGLVLEYVERGDTPRLREATAAFQQLLARTVG